MARFSSLFVLVRFARDRGPTAADQKIEIGAFRGLHHVLYVHLLIASGHRGRRGPPIHPSSIKLVFRHIELQTTSVDVEFDDVAILYKRQRSASSSLRAHMQHH